MKICVIDKDEAFLAKLGPMLSARGCEPLMFRAATEALPVIRKEAPNGLIWNLGQFHEQDALDLQELRRENPALFVALTGDMNGSSVAHQLLNKGACEFLRKPVTAESLDLFFHQMEAPARFSHPAELQTSLLARKYRFFELIGQTPEMHQLYEKIEVVSHNQGTVLIQGEIGTGKDKVAKAIHQNSDRRRGPFLKFSCSIVPKELFDAELFGNLQDTGNLGVIQKKGAMEMASGGTLFLDEVEHIPLETQLKLIEFFQAKAAQAARPAGDKPVPAPARIIAGTGANLLELTQKSQFRYELYYRISILPIDMPPLRERQNDIPQLVEYFLAKFSPQTHFEVYPDAMKLLVNYRWPGNIRQLETIIERLVLTVPGPVIFRHHLPEEITQDHLGNFDLDSDKSLEDIVAQVECMVIKKALHATNGNMKEAARNLKVPYSSFRIKLQKYHLEH